MEGQEADQEPDGSARVRRRDTKLVRDLMPAFRSQQRDEHDLARDSPQGPGTENARGSSRTMALTIVVLLADRTNWQDADGRVRHSIKHQEPCEPVRPNHTVLRAHTHTVTLVLQPVRPGRHYFNPRGKALCSKL